MNNFTFGIIFGALLAGTTTAQAQVNAADSVMNHVKGNKLSLVRLLTHATSIAIMVIVIQHLVSIRKTQVMVDLIFLMQLSTLVTTSVKVGQWVVK